MQNSIIALQLKKRLLNFVHILEKIFIIIIYDFRKDKEKNSLKTYCENYRRYDTYHIIKIKSSAKTKRVKRKKI